MTKGFNPISAFEKMGKSVGGELAGGIVRTFGGSKHAQDAAKNIGGTLGEIGAPLAGAALGFKKGGRVPGKKGAPVKAIVHGGEFVLPNGVKPTKAQQKAVAVLKMKDKKKK